MGDPIDQALERLHTTLQRNWDKQRQREIDKSRCPVCQDLPFSCTCDQDYTEELD